MFDGLYYVFESGAPITGYFEREKFGTFVKKSVYTRIRQSQDQFTVTGNVICSDGKMFYYKDQQMIIEEYDGVKRLEDLPIRILDRRSKRELTERGRLFKKLAIGHNFKEY